MNNLENKYSILHKSGNLGSQEIKLKSWPKNRFQAAIFFAGNGENVLDVGCGNGLVLYNLRRKYKNLYGIELSRERAILSEKTLRKYNAKILNINIEDKTTLKENFFDLIICSDVVEHLVDIYSSFNEMRRLLRPGGRLIIITPNFIDIRRRFSLLFGKFPSTSYSNEGFKKNLNSILYDGGHLHYFTYSVLEKLFIKYNFKEIRKYGCGRFRKFHNILPSLFSPSCIVIGTKQ